jgi:CheY-like chemotaxis protein
MDDRRIGTEDRRRAWKPRRNHSAPAKPTPDPAPPTVPDPIPWIPTRTPSDDPTGAGLHPFSDVVRVIDGLASTLGDPAIQSTLPFRRPLRLVKPLVDAPRPFTVLLVDDNHHCRIPLLRALRAENYDVLYAADGVRGEDLCRTTFHEIDALIARAQMRRMSGFELARRVRRSRPEIAVLLMGSSFASRELAVTAQRRDFPLLEEPFTAEQLTLRLAEVLTVSRSNASADQ